METLLVYEDFERGKVRQYDEFSHIHAVELADVILLIQ